MGTSHTFQTPHVVPLPTVTDDESAGLMLSVTPAEAERIFRALEETSSHLAAAPSGSRIAASYRRLAASLRVQANGAYEPAPRMIRHRGYAH